MKKKLLITIILLVFVVGFIAPFCFFHYVLTPSRSIGDSMEPNIYEGDIIWVYHFPKDINQGDIVSYDYDLLKNRAGDIKRGLISTSIAHRVIKISENKYTTKGDNNNGVDFPSLNKENIDGKVIAIWRFNKHGN